MYFIVTNAVSQFLHTFVCRLVHDVVHTSHRLQIDKQILEAYYRFASHSAFELHDSQKVGDIVRSSANFKHNGARFTLAIFGIGKQLYKDDRHTSFCFLTVYSTP